MISILGLVLKQQGNYEEALECFQKFTGSLALLPGVVYQIASLLERIGDSEAAAESYQQLIGLVPTDASALQRIGELYDHEGDKQQAYHYHFDVRKLKKKKNFPKNFINSSRLSDIFQRV